MDATVEISTLVGATGGAGTTRLAVEIAATLADAGRDALVVDAALATQGLSRYVDGRLDPDLATLLVEAADSLDGTEPTLRDAIRPIAGGPAHESSAIEGNDPPAGELACLPSYAPFARLARAQTADAAQRFESLLAEAAAAFDHVLVDCPPVASNLAVAAVTAADRVAVIAPASPRGADAVQRTRGRLEDVGAASDLLVANRAADDHPVGAADVAVPRASSLPDGAPAVPETAPPAYRRAVGSLTAQLCAVDLDLPEASGSVAGRLAERVPGELPGRR